MPIAVIIGLLAIITELMNYDRIEQVMIAMMLGLLVIYVSIADLSVPSLAATLGGFVPHLPGGSLTLVVAIFGTTALWPNFFLESNLVAQKGWTNATDVSTMQHDLGIGYAVGGLTTIAIVIVTTAVLQPAGYTQLESFIMPGVALSAILGDRPRRAADARGQRHP